MPQDVDIEDLNPDRNLEVFNRSPVVFAFILAVMVHIVVIGGTSYRYVHQLIDPQAFTKEEAPPPKPTLPIEKPAEAPADGKAPAVPSAGTAPGGTSGQQAPVDNATPKDQIPKDKVKNQEYLDNLDKAEKPPEDPVFDPDLGL